MRRVFVLAAVIVAGTLAATVIAQRSDNSPERSQRPRADATREADRDRDRAPGDAAPPPGMGPETKLEWMMVRPGKVRVRDTWNVGRVECKPWNAPADAEKAFVRVNAVIVRDADKADDKATGIELILESQGQDPDRTFLFDEGQVGELMSAIEALDNAAQRLREPPRGASRRTIWTLNGLEIGMTPRRTGGYLAPMSPDEKSTGLSPDDFNQLRRLLDDAKTVLARESAR